ncbi:MAG: NLP/P60 hydrolase [Paracoccus denitrificans]|nr:MAG: NLP/P60 hydrolase [Paracoccus denitrificans]PZO86300.1 MAG: NLP/P60 hydrolase [Paracoccus denitrificans]
MSVPDRRSTPATDRVALQGSGIDRPQTTKGTPMRVAVPVADLLRAPGGARDRQVLFGADVTVIDRQDGLAFIQAAADGYCGWIDDTALAAPDGPTTHRVSAPSTHVYSRPDIKSPELMTLSLGARVSVAGDAIDDGRFAQLTTGGWVPAMHLSDQPATDPVAEALSLIGTPYLWGGNSRQGIDCSGTAQAALLACGIACPGDSDQQEKAFPAVDAPYHPGDLLFWPGHVAMAIDAETMVHATAWKMAVITENIASAIARIDAAGDGPFLGARRPEFDRA